ncbi:nitrate reductase cytochrome c-type subunit [Campylobacter sp. RM9344]|uniref:Periplasmic nitrate reductase, electron transfer subunit n=1 Tax=Campylobacter californiensis TaxID=1032243 RepID=A0AAW3ZV72_9BACT|nr:MULTISPECIES: nitrate reductase cytochrome c-type subunit [unclassified Campylobacter]MBE2984882.1 nitrate reductase cytochrome c-type subunit [Campylobacter sp. RM6883]MBE2986315.1 nitrate reductase cytochrome c-type subunit [Campylobacter sp. RM12919]MBE2988054.1 nitrate reductase cytochrome c-type subunit [Campylobacter sp. RM12920]MBE2995342.1 nitrate reductase cytochrome c-type subunit [Campylobacter sp. RM6913]MBE3022427.1 nitrate reductase cytochrome c-type subunit [Campylobacter sp.
MKFKFIAFGALLALILSACAVSNKSISDTDMGFRGDLTNDNIAARDINYSAEPAGMSKKFDRSFENAPPFIPHDLEGLVPITKDMNMCVTCHMPEFAADSGATPIPASHLYDLRNKTDLKGILHDERFNCTTCHVSQADVKVPIKNNFTPEFRDANGSAKSNLLDILNEGVR